MSAEKHDDKHAIAGRVDPLVRLAPAVAEPPDGVGSKLCTRCGKAPKFEDKSICASCWCTTLLILGSMIPK